tara:strand:+ start:971 stop:1417 length:447 start_codon:yes stop_codon:yes gene_type:complete
MPEWLSDINIIGSAASIIGLTVTIFLFIEARSIRKSFLRTARLPELNKDLAKATSEISSHIKTWENNKEPALEKFLHAKALLENVKKKLPQNERRMVERYLNLLQPKRSLLKKREISCLDRDEAFKLYSELNGLVTSLRELDKDNTWN